MEVTLNINRILSAAGRFALLIVLLTLAGCASSPEINPVVQKPNSLIDYALSLQGTPYRWGKESPAEGFDCSGFVKHVYGRYGIRLPRTARAMAAALPPIDSDEIRAGDLVFFNTDNVHYYSHVGLYLNNDKFIHASSSRSGKVMISSMNTKYWRKHFVGIRRPMIN